MFENKNMRIVDIPFVVMAGSFCSLCLLFLITPLRITIATPIVSILLMLSVAMRESIRRKMAAQYPLKPLLPIYLGICGTAIAILIISTIYACLR